MFPARADVLFVSAEDGDHVTVTLSVAVLAGKPAFVGLALAFFRGAPLRELSAGDVHELPTESLFADAVRAIAASFADERTGPGRGNWAVEGEAAVRAARQRHPMTDELLREVAEVVNADDRGEPRQAIRRHFHVAERTASRWHALARQRFPELFG